MQSLLLVSADLLGLSSALLGVSSCAVIYAIALLPSDHERVPDLGFVEKFFRGRDRGYARGGINFIRPGVIVEQYLKVITKAVVLLIFFSTLSTRSKRITRLLR